MEYQELLNKLNKNKEDGQGDVYIISSVGGKGVHIGRIKEISQDAEGDIVIEADIDLQSITDERMINQEKAKEYKEKMIGKLYRHFKGNIYKVIDIAIHSETAEPMVLYQSVDNPEFKWVRPLDMFLSEVDHEKYPDVKQRLRFEPI